MFTVFARLAARKLAKDDGVAGLIVAMIISIVAFSALSVFMSKHAGPTRELERVKESNRQETILKAAFIAHLNSGDDGVPCPDTNLDGLENAPCTTGGGTVSGTLPWSTLGIAKEDAFDNYGTYYTYVVARDEKAICVTVPNDYNTNADSEYSGDTLEFEDLQIVATTAGATGTRVPFALISHGKNRLGGTSSSGTTIAAPSGSNELTNATANPATIYTGPYDSAATTYFDDTVWAPVTSDLATAC